MSQTFFSTNQAPTSHTQVNCFSDTQIDLNEDLPLLSAKTANRASNQGGATASREMFSLICIQDGDSHRTNTNPSKLKAEIKIKSREELKNELMSAHSALNDFERTSNQKFKFIQAT